MNEHDERLLEAFGSYWRSMGYAAPTLTNYRYELKRLAERRPLDQCEALDLRAFNGARAKRGRTGGAEQRGASATSVLPLAGLRARLRRAVTYSYPVPILRRDSAFAVIQPWLADRDTCSRFGAWRYEIGNTDHSVRMGVELACYLVDGTLETTLLPCEEARAVIS